MAKVGSNGTGGPVSPRSSKTGLAASERVRRLEAELRRTKAQLGDLTRAGAVLRASERRLVEAQQLAGVGIWEWSLDTDEAWWSPVVYQLWGLAVADRPPPTADELPIHPEDRKAYEEALAPARETGELNIEWRVVLPDRSIRWLAARGRIEQSEHGRRILGVVQDVTERKQTETRLKTLLNELQHRVRNILGVVRSIIGRTVRTSHSMDELASHLDGRLATLARTQSLFTVFGETTVELEQIIRDEMLAAAASEEQVTIDGPSVVLRRDAAETFALALHELCTNALKYGALSRLDGRITIRWRILDAGAGPRLSLAWQESGMPVVDTTPSRAGFGRDLIERGLPYELGAATTLEFGQGGVRALIDLPLTDKVAVLEPHEGADHLRQSGPVRLDR